MDLGTLDATGVTSGSFTFGGFSVTGGPVTTHTRFTDGILRGGLNYKFYWSDYGLRVKAFRRRQSWGIHRRSIDVTEAWLDQLEKRGYLDPDRRGDRNDECDAIEMFLTDSLLNG
jgi:hypothetical protein